MKKIGIIVSVLGIVPVSYSMENSSSSSSSSSPSFLVLDPTLKYKGETVVGGSAEKIPLFYYCVVCKEPCKNVCKHCNAYYYCSLACQSLDWKKTHKQRCASLKKAHEGEIPQMKAFFFGHLAGTHLQQKEQECDRAAQQTILWLGRLIVRTTQIILEKDPSKDLNEEQGALIADTINGYYLNIVCIPVALQAFANTNIGSLLQSAWKWTKDSGAYPHTDMYPQMLFTLLYEKKKLAHNAIKEVNSLFTPSPLN